MAGVCAALVGRAATGKGRHVDTALYDCMIGMHDFAVQCYTMSGGKELPVQTGHDLPQATVYGVFAARDGNLVIAAQVDDAWKRLAQSRRRRCARANDVRFHTPEGRNANREEVLGKVKAWAQTATVKECTRALDAADVPCAPVQNIDAVLADPQVAGART